MTKGLEELEKLQKDDIENDNLHLHRQCNYSVIKKELEELQERREMMKRFNEACVPMILDNETEKKLKALNEILALHNKWLGNEISDFEFFTLLNEVREKYGLSKEVLL